MTEEEIKQALVHYENHPPHSVTDDGIISYDYIIGLIQDYAKWITSNGAFYKGRNDGFLQTEVKAIRDHLLSGNSSSENDFQQVNKIVRLIDVLHCHFIERGAFKYHNNQDSQIHITLTVENPDFMDQYNRIGNDIVKGYFGIKELQLILKDQRGIGSCINEIKSILKEKQIVNEIQPVPKLQWKGQKNQMYYVLNDLRGKGFITNSHEHLAEFLRQCVTGFENTTHITISGELSRGTKPTKAKRPDLSWLPQNDKTGEQTAD
jgi:hypothetical protein